jgi:hypothetical protein
VLCFLWGTDWILNSYLDWLQGPVLSPTSYSLYINDAPQTPGVHLALFAGHNCRPIYTTEREQDYVLRNLKRGLTSMETCCECWKIKINEDKTQAIYFSRTCRPVEASLILNWRNIPFVNNVKYLGVNFDRMITWRLGLYLEMIDAKIFKTFLGIYSLFKSKRLSAKIKLTVRKAFIRSVITYACLARVFAADSYLLKFQRLQNNFLHIQMHTGPRYACGFQNSAYLWFYHKLWMQQAEFVQNNHYRDTGQGEVQHKEHKRLKRDSGQPFKWLGSRYNIS